MEHKLLIQDFFDGLIDEGKEDDLFMLMSMNREIRREFKNHLTIESALKNDARLIPMASTTLGVFSRIGFKTPESLNTMEVNEAGNVNTGRFLKKYSHSIYTGIITALVTSLIFMLFMTKDTESSKAALSASASRNIENPINKLKPKEYNSVSVEKHVTERPIKYVYITKHDTIISNYKTEDKILPDINKSLALKTTPSDLRNSKTDLMKPIEFSPDIFNARKNVLHKDAIYKEMGISLGLTFSQDWALNGPAVRESYMPKFNNWGVFALYDINNKLSIGLDFRKEFFYQKYDGSDEYGTKFTYKQNTNYICAGIAAKYKFYNIGAFDTYMQCFAGGNVAGPIVRLQTGLDYRTGLFNYYYLGFEGSVLNYHHSNKQFYSPKIGLNFGAAFSF